MERYRQLYGEWQDFKRQQPFGWTQFFANQFGTVYSQDGSRSNVAIFSTLHEAVHANLTSLTPIQVQKYTEDMQRKLNLFIRWLQHGQRLRGWRGQASGKENESPEFPPPSTRTGLGVMYRRSGYQLH